MKELTNIPDLSVNDAIENLTLMYSSFINNGFNIKDIPSAFLWGPMGVGKSDSVKQVAKKLESLTNKKVVVTDVRLLLFSPIDLRGIPTANADKTLAVWLKPQIFNMDSSKDVINVLFLDELSAAPQSVQAAAYQITLDKTVGEHKLPDNCIVIAAGNRTSDKSVSFSMPRALANRLMHFDIKSDYESWNEWAVKSNINEKVLGFLKFKPDYLMKFDPSSTDLAFPTPRSWEKVSHILNYVADDPKKVKTLIGGLIGTGVAIEFITWTKVFNKLPSIEDIFNGKKPDVPKEFDTLYALTSSMVNYAKRHLDELDKIENSIEYSFNFPPDFSVVLLKDYMYMEENYKNKLLKIPAFQRWLQTRGKLLDAAK